MKKICFFIISFLFLSSNVSAATTPTLEQIVDTFNNHSVVKENATLGSIWTANSSGNTLNISVNASGETTNLSYTLNNNILSATFNSTQAFTGTYVSMYLIDSIAQLHGYSENEILPIFNSNEFANYKVENEGVEIAQGTSGETIIKIDISKKIPLIDLSNEYIKIEDLQNLKDSIYGNGSAELSKGYVWFHKSGYDGENTLLIAEKNEFTNNAYKSILSILEVMFDSNEVVEYFKTNYSNISSDKEFSGFKIEINPTKTVFEESLVPSDSGYKFMRISINKQEVINRLNAIKEDQNITNPQTGVNLPFIGLIILLLVSLSTIVFISRKHA